MVPRR